MNAISPVQPASTAAENIAMLQELIVLGMQLARTAGQNALRDLQAPETPAKTPGAGTLFLRLWSAMRQTMALQTRLAAGGKSQPRPASAPSPTPIPTPAPAGQISRDTTLKHVLDLARKPTPDGSLLPPETLEKLERDLARALKAGPTPSAPFKRP